MFASQQHEHFIPIHVVDPTAQYTRNFKNAHHFPNPNSDYTPAHSNSPPTMSLDHIDMMMPAHGHGQSYRDSEFSDFPPQQQIHKIEIPTCFRQSEEPGNSVGQRKQGPPPPINIHAENQNQNQNQNQNHQCPQAQAMYNNFMEQQNQQQHTPMNSSPLNSPGFNGIRHIPIFFEGKNKAQQQQQNQQNQNSQQNNNNNNNNNNSSNKNQSSSNFQNNNNNATKDPISSVPIPLPSPTSIPIPVPVKCGVQRSPAPTSAHEDAKKSPSSPTFNFNFNQDQFNNNNEEPKAPPRQKNNNSNNNSNSGSDNEAQPPLKKPTPSHSNSNSPPSTPKGNTPMERVQVISEDVKKLEKDVQDFKGLTKTKEYLYLDEMLTRNLLRLDDICVEGQMEVRLARKECINLVNSCISKLEAKIEPKNNNNNNDSNPNCTEIVPFVQNQSQNQNTNGIIAIPVIDERNKSSKNNNGPFQRSEVHLHVNGGEA